MLKFLRGKKRSRNLLLIVFVGLLTLSLIGLFGVVVSGGASGIFRSGGDDSVIARVGNLDVTAKELKNALAAFSQQVAQGRGQAAAENLATTYALYGQQVLDSLIRDKLMIYEADQLNMGASDAEVQAKLRQIFSPWPGPEIYRMRLEQAGLSPLTFEDNLRASIAQEHLRSYISAAAEVPPSDVEEDYRKSNTQYSVRWVAITPESVRDKVAVSDADLRAFFDSHKEDFKITSEQRRARYVFVDQKKAGDTIHLSDDELKQNFNPENYVTQVRVSEIVLNVPKQEAAAASGENADANKPAEKAKVASEEEIRTKAQDLAKRAQGAEGAVAEDFATLARENSDDAKSKASGGDLGWINKSDKRDTDDPLNRVFTMKKGDVSQPIKKGDKYYILKVTDRKLPTFAERRDQLIKDERARKSYSKAVEMATEAEQRLKETKNTDAVVAEINKKYNAPVAVARETPFFAQGDKLPELGTATEFQSAVFALQNLNDVSEHMNVEKGFAVAQYVEKRDPHDPTFEETRSKVEDRYRTEKSKELAEQRASQIAQAKTADEMKKIADSLGVITEERAGLPASDSIGPLVSEAERSKIYKLNVGEVTHEPIKSDSGENYVVAALVARKDADMGDAFQKEKKSIEQRLLDEKRNIYFQTYLSETQTKMKGEGKIKIYEDRITDALAAGGAPVLPSPTRRTRRGPRG